MSKIINTSNKQVTMRKDSDNKSLSQIMSQASRSAISGGLAGAAAMGANVSCLMWLRTTVNYQYRNGANFTTSLSFLYRDGGIPRFYRGILPALLQGPLSRFGDTAANTGAITLLNSYDMTKNLPIGVKTAVASFSAAVFRIFLMPIDTIKTTMQVTGKFKSVIEKIKTTPKGPLILYDGSLAAASATFVGHFPWFFTYNYLSSKIPEYKHDKMKELGRRALIGFCSSAVSDSISNSIRIIKVYKQSSLVALTYNQVIQSIIEESGWKGLFFRGLETKILSNGLQGILFSVLWKYFQEILERRSNDKKQL